MNTNSTAVVGEAQKEQDFFKSLDLATENADTVKTLTYDFLMLEAVRGQNALEIGRKLMRVREALSPAGSGAWRNWCDTFTYTKDYANRMIQVAEKFSENMPGVMELSFRHLREIARFSDNQTDLEKLTALASSHNLSAHETRYLVSESNASAKSGGTPVDLDQLVQQHPNLKAEIERRMKAAKDAGKSESAADLDKAQAKLRELSDKAETLGEKLEARNAKVNDLTQQVKTQVAAEILGDGDPEVGHLKIKLEQAVQHRDNVQVALDQTQKDLRKVQYELDKYINSPTGQAKMDLKKVLDDSTKFFKDTMTPAYLAMRVQGVGSPEAAVAVRQLLATIRDWSDNVEALLDVPQVVEANS